MDTLKKQIILRCRAKKMKITALRERVLNLILTENGVIKAYKIIAKMQDLEQRNIAPPTVYRCLDFWAAAGILHRIDAVNGFILCRHLYEEHHQHALFVFVCRQCGSVDEPDFCDLAHRLDKACSQEGFSPDDSTIVLTGICRHCCC